MLQMYPRKTVYNNNPLKTVYGGTEKWRGGASAARGGSPNLLNLRRQQQVEN